MKDFFRLVVLSFLVVTFSCCQEKEKNKKADESGDIQNQETSLFLIEAKGIESKECYFALTDKKNKLEDSKVPFGSKLLFVLDELSGFTEVNNLYNIGFKVSVFNGDNLIRNVEDIFANDPGIKPENLSYLYAYLDIYYPVSPGNKYIFKAIVWDKNSENKLFASGEFEMEGEIPGNFVVKEKNVLFTSIILKKNTEIASDNIYKSGDLVKITVEGFEGFTKTEDGYSFTETYTLIEMDGTVISPEQSKEINIPKMDRLISGFPIEEVFSPTEIYWNLRFKDNNSDAEINIKTQLSLKP